MEGKIAKHISNKELLSTVCKELLKLNQKTKMNFSCAKGNSLAVQFLVGAVTAGSLSSILIEKLSHKPFSVARKKNKLSERSERTPHQRRDINTKGK